MVTMHKASPNPTLTLHVLQAQLEKVVRENADKGNQYVSARLTTPFAQRIVEPSTDFTSHLMCGYVCACVRLCICALVC